MGGFGSGWRRARTDVVEHCLVLSIADLVREKVIAPGTLERGVWAWSRPGQQPHARVNYEADLRLTNTPLSTCDTASMIEAKVLTYGFAIRSRNMAVGVGGFCAL